MTIQSGTGQTITQRRVTYDRKKSISFDCHMQQNEACSWYGPGIYWLQLPDDFSAEEMFEIRRKVFQYATNLCKDANKPITYKSDY